VIEFATEARISVIRTIALPKRWTSCYKITSYIPDFYTRTMCSESTRRNMLGINFTRPGIFAMCFVVRDLKVNCNSSSVNSCYVVRGESTLIQETQVHDYIPQERVCLLPDGAFLRNRVAPNCKNPSALMELLEHLESCIAPFLQKDVRLNVRPVFLIKGPRCCGKHELVRASSNRMGLNFLDVNFVEVQTLTSAQTEAKLRIMLQNAQQYVPCKFVHVHLYITIELMLKNYFLNSIWIFIRSYVIVAKVENANP